MSQLPGIAENIFPQSAGLYYSLDCDGQLLQWNAELEQISGLVAAELAGQKFLDMVVIGDRPAVQQALDDTLRQGVNEFRARINTVNGVVEYLFKTLTNVDLDGHQRSIIGVAQKLIGRQQPPQPNDLDIVNSRLREQQSALLQLSRSRFHQPEQREQLLRLMKTTAGKL